MNRLLPVNFIIRSNNPENNFTAKIFFAKNKVKIE